MKNENKGIGYYVGQTVGCILVACATSLVIAFTIKLISWMF